MIDHVAKAVQKVAKAILPAWYLPNGTKYASDDELEGASSSCECWGIWCGLLVIVSVIAETAGTIAHPEYGLFLTFSAITDVGVGVGITGEVLLSMRNSVLQTELRRRLSEQLAAAKLELARIATPRCNVIAPHKDEIITKLSPFKGTKFDVAHSERGREEWDFVWWLEEMPAKAGWVFVDWNPGPLPHPGNFRKLNWTMRRHVYGVANVSNVVI